MEFIIQRILRVWYSVMTFKKNMLWETETKSFDIQFIFGGETASSCKYSAYLVLYKTSWEKKYSYVLSKYADRKNSSPTFMQDRERKNTPSFLKPLITISYYLLSSTIIATEKETKIAIISKAWTYL